MADTLAYVLLGAAGSGRREILSDLALACDADSVAVHSSEADLFSADALPREIQPVTWKWSEGFQYTEAPVDGPEVIFLLTDGRTNPVDQVEALPQWLQARQASLARILTVVDASLAEADSAVLPWYDACIHFSDVVLLNRLAGLPGSWAGKFRARYERAFLPCLFETVRAGKVKNPALVLDPLPRRLAQFLDEGNALELFRPAEPDPEDAFDDDAPDEPEGDPYLARLPSGQRVKPIPKISAILERAGRLPSA
ncbi:MAG: hypothetical protein EA425_09470 [Puniceicoccaceae bacterium]|nr:MAG: hypothetical protein EA425_09470 [Puniceicoccaceae bacterium]